jgi:uncharacterized PurR-regulated membrane protein YhhQ (DUF165 family)
MTRRIGWLFWVGFLITIPLANWTLHRYGFREVPGLGMVPSGVAWVGFSFVFRDVAQYLLGRKWAWLAIGLGTLLSWLLADAGLALASGLAFLWSESTDALIFTPLANRGRFALGVWISGVAASVVDSILFLQIAFHSTNGWWQLFVVKSAFVLIASPIALGIRRRIKVAPA